MHRFGSAGHDAADLGELSDSRSVDFHTFTADQQRTTDHRGAVAVCDATPETKADPFVALLQWSDRGHLTRRLKRSDRYTLVPSACWSTEECTCRICLADDVDIWHSWSAAEPLCRCRDLMHPACVLQWIETRGLQECEVCHSPWNPKAVLDPELRARFERALSGALESVQDPRSVRVNTPSPFRTHMREAEIQQTQQAIAQALGFDGYTADSPIHTITAFRVGRMTAATPAIPLDLAAPPAYRGMASNLLTLSLLASMSLALFSRRGAESMLRARVHEAENIARQSAHLQPFAPVLQAVQRQHDLGLMRHSLHIFRTFQSLPGRVHV
jgi:hypothetical protein